MQNLNNILRFIELEGISNRWFEAEVGLANGTLSNSKRRKTDLSKENISKIVDRYSTQLKERGFEIVDLNDFGGDGMSIRFKDESKQESNETDQAPFVERRLKKKLDNKPSGMPVFESSPMTLSNKESFRDEQTDQPDFWLSIPQYRKCNYACRAKGDSMHPVIRNHALVGGKEITDLSVIIFGDIYIVHTRNGIETIKYIHPDPLNLENILLVPYNENAKTTPIHKSDILRLYQAEFVINPL